MIAGVIIKEAVGLLCIVLGLLIWIKKKVSLIHSYHYKKVKAEDLPSYARLVGISLILIGLGICISGVLDLLYSTLWWVPLVVGFVAGAILFYITQKKYNGSVF